MCKFGGSKKAPPPAPAPALPAPTPPPEAEEVGSGRAAEEETLFGPGGNPDFRVDRTGVAGSVGGGSGLKM